MRESSAELTSKYGFSVVAPISVDEALLDRGQQRVLLGLVEAVDLVEEEDRRARRWPGGAAGRARARARTSGRPASTALSSSNAACAAAATIRASVVFPDARRAVEDHRVRPALLDRARAAPSPRRAGAPGRRPRRAHRGRMRAGEGTRSGAAPARSAARARRVCVEELIHPTILPARADGARPLRRLVLPRWPSPAGSSASCSATSACPRRCSSPPPRRRAPARTSHLARPRRPPRRSPTSAPGASTGGCSRGWRRRRSPARSSAATSPACCPRDALLLVIAAVLLYSAFDLSRWTPPTAARDHRRRLDLRAAARSRGALIGLLGGDRRPDPRLAADARAAQARRRGARARGRHERRRRLLGRRRRRDRPPALRGAGLGRRGVSAPPPRSPARCSGSRLTGRLSERQLVRAIAAVLLVRGIATAVGGASRSLTAMAAELEQETTELLQRLVALRHGQPAGQRARRAGASRRRCCATPASRSSCSAAPSRARTSSRACAAAADGPALCLLSPRGHRPGRRRRSGSTTRGRATSPTASCGAAARRT